MKIPKGISKFFGFFPGHLKWNYAYSIGHLQPDVVVSLWPPEGWGKVNGISSDAKKYLQESYSEVHINDFSFYLLKSSTNIL
jgi:hypothetical protein